MLAYVMAGKGRPRHRSDTRSITVSLPAETMNYLVLLAERGKLGPSEQDVAAHILVREVDRMIALDYHDQRFPQPQN
jgi:hypothetical protein